MASHPCIYGGYVRLELTASDHGAALEEIVQGAHAIFTHPPSQPPQGPATAQERDNGDGDGDEAETAAKARARGRGAEHCTPWKTLFGAAVRASAVTLTPLASASAGAANANAEAVVLPLAACVHLSSCGASIYLVLRERGQVALCHRLRFRGPSPVQALLRDMNAVLAALPDDDTACAPAPRAEGEVEPSSPQQQQQQPSSPRRASWATLMHKMGMGKHSRSSSPGPGLSGSGSGSGSPAPSSPGTLERSRVAKRRQRKGRCMSTPELPYNADADADAPLYDVRTMAGLLSSAPARRRQKGGSHASLDSGWDSDSNDADADADADAGADADGVLYAVPPTPPLQRARGKVPGHRGRRNRLAGGARAHSDEGVSVSVSTPIGVADLDDNVLAEQEAAELKELRRQPYYHGHLDFAAAEAELEDAPPGAYLVRAADAQEETFVISAVNTRGTVSHLGILHFSGRYHVTGCASERAFSVKELVERHVASDALLSGCHLYQFIPCLSK